MGRRNKGKEHTEIIGQAHICYYFYTNGTVIVSVENSNNPFKIEDDTDRSRLMVFFGQVRDRLVTFLMDRHERIVPDILDWELTCRSNCKDPTSHKGLLDGGRTSD